MTRLTRVPGVPLRGAPGPKGDPGPIPTGTELVARKNQPNGYAGLDAGQKLDPNQLPALAITDVHVVGSQAAMLAIPNPHAGMVAIRTDLDSASFMHNGGTAGTVADWTEIGLVNAVPLSQKGAPSGVGTLDVNGKQPVGEVGSSVVSDILRPGARDQALAWNGLTSKWRADDGVHSPYAARLVSVTNQFVDPRATNPANFAAVAPGLEVIPAIVKPASTAVGGGTVAAGNYLFGITYVTATGETLPGPVWNIYVPAGATNTITINSPINPPYSVTGWYVYMTQAGGSTYTRQQAAGSPTAIGTDFTLTAPPTNTGAAPPAANTTAAGTVTQGLTGRADGYQQQARPLSCQEIIATPTPGGYVGIATTTRLPISFYQFAAARAAAKVVGVVGGSTWHLALAMVYYDSTNKKLYESVIWSSPKQTTADSTALSTLLGGYNGWVTVEGHDNQTDGNVAYFELQVRVYNDSGAPGAVTLRATEVVEAIDPDGDIPYYVGGDLGIYGASFAPWWGYWIGSDTRPGGAADNSQSVGVFDPAQIYTKPTEFGFNNYGAAYASESPPNSVKLVRELGCTVTRENVFTYGGGPGPPYAAPLILPKNLAYLQSLIASGVKLILEIFPPTAVCPANYGWPTDPTVQAAWAQTVVTLIGQIIGTNDPSCIYGVEGTNEPNLGGSGGWTGCHDPTSYVAYLNAMYTAVKATYPNIKVFGGTIATMSATVVYGQPLPTDWLQAMYDHGAQYDVLDLHVYPAQSVNVYNQNWLSGTSAPPASAIGFSTGYLAPGWTNGWDGSLKKMSDVMAANGDAARPIFISESGSQSLSEKLQGQVAALQYGRARRDARVLGICFNAIVDGPSGAWPYWFGDWGCVDPVTYRRRYAARVFARMNSMPEPLWSAREVLRHDPSMTSTFSAVANATAAPGALIANNGKTGQIVLGGNNLPQIIFGGDKAGGASATVGLVTQANQIVAGSVAGDIAVSTSTVGGTIRTSAPVRIGSVGIQSNGVALDATSYAGTATSLGAALGDKIALYGSGASGYGIGAQSGRTVLYIPITAAVGIRATSTVGQASSGTDAIALQANGTAWFFSSSPSIQTVQIRGAAAQTANLLEVQNSSGVPLTKAQAAGDLVVRADLGVGGMFIGDVGVASSVGIATQPNANSTGYGLLLTATATAINAPSGGNVLARIAGTTVANVTGTGVILSQVLDVTPVTGTATAAGTGVGDKIAMYSSGAAGYGLGIQASRIVAYVGSSSAGLAVRLASGSGAASSGADAVLLLASGTGVFTSTAPGTTVLTLKAAAAQTADILQLQDSAASPLLNITSTGKITQYEYIYANWKTLPHLTVIACVAASTMSAAGVFPIYATGTVASITAANSSLCVFYLDPADYAAGSRTVKIRLRAICITNSVAPGITLTLQLLPVASFAGAGPANPIIFTAGAAVFQVSFVTPGAYNGGQVGVSSTVTFPAAGFYFFALVTSGAAAANSAVTVSAQVQIQQV